MPELPEVETMVRDLRDRVLGEIIETIDVAWDRMVAHPSVEGLKAGTRGRGIASINRLGKFAIFGLDDGTELAIHRGMTGSLLLRPPGAPEDRFVRARVDLRGGWQLRLDDSRKFGRLFWWNPRSSQWQPPWLRLGLEPLSPEFTAGDLRKGLLRRKAPIKTVILSQRVVAGVGNIYADESLFLAKIKPTRSSRSLSKTEVSRLRDVIVDVLTRAIQARGTTFSTYRDVEGDEGSHQRELMVFRRHPGPCLRCGGEITRIVLGGRGTHFCVGCQR